MSGTMTGVLEVVGSDGQTKVFEWNGNVDDRQTARSAFETLASEGGILATVVESPGKATQVRTFDEIEEIERERGTVTARVSPQVVGG